MLEQLREEIDEKIPKKTQKLLIYLIAAVILIIGGAWIARPIMISALSTQKQVAKYETEYKQLKKMDADKEKNEKEAAQLEADTEKILAKYPKDIFPEDMIIAISRLEGETGAKITDVSIDTTNVVTDNNDKTALSQASDSTKSSSTTDAAAAADAASNSTSSSASSSASNTTSNSTSSSSNVANAATGKTVVNTDTYSLYTAPVSVAYEVSYTGLKQLFSSVFASPFKKNIESVSITYDETTGLLMGTMVMNFYSLDYTDNQVNGHESMEGITRGTANVFHSIQ